MQHNTEDILTIHHCTSEADIDFDQLLALLTQVEAFDQEGIDLSESALRAHLARKGRERWISRPARTPDRLIGYAWLAIKNRERAVPFVVVHPEWRRRGLGSQLLDRTLQLARERGSAHATNSAHAENDGANAFLRRHGFRVAGFEWAMHAPADTAFDDPVWPAGYTVQPYTQIQDPTVLARVCNESRRDMWGHDENTPGTLTEKEIPMLLSFWAAENIFLVLTEAGQAVGICAVQPNRTPGVHVIDAPTLVPAHRRRGLHQPMVHTAARRLRQCGAKAVKLESYGDDKQTIDVYRKTGFILDSQYIAYRYDLE